MVKKNTKNSKCINLDQYGSDSLLTGNSTQSRENLTKKILFVLNNWTDDEYKNIMDHIIKKNMYYVIGKEIGEQGTPHLQGYLECKTRFRPIEYFKNKRIHFEYPKGSRDDNFKYCIKDGDYATNMHDICYLPIHSIEDMYPWQKELIDICCKKPDSRTIYWFWDDKGNSGKTTIAKYLSFYHKAVPLRGKTNDILHCAAEHASNIYIFISPRTNEDYFPYEGLELVKDGYFMSGKYESKPIIRNNPHVIVFANFEPNIDKLSKDRWVTIDISRARSWARVL